MRIVEVFNIWANSNRLPPKAGKLDRCLLSRMLQLETLEGRITPTTYSVVNTFDTGAGSLMQAITDANNTAGDDQIIFNLTGTNPYTITLGLALPTIVSASTAILTGGTAGTLTITGLGASSLTINDKRGSTKASDGKSASGATSNNSGAGTNNSRQRQPKCNGVRGGTS